MNLEKIFDEVALVMEAEARKTRNAISHPGSKGTAFESELRKFLRNYFPKSVDISTGIIIDSNGQQSNQVDIIISDAAKAPIFYCKDDLRVIPIECVYSVLEVKAHLTIKELIRCFVNMKSVRRLEKKAYYPTKEKYMHTLYGSYWKIWPVNYYVFAYDSIKLERLGKFIDDKHKEEQLAVTSRIDSLCVLNKGIITNRLASGTFDALPQKNSQLGHYYTRKALLLFYTLIIRYINQIGMPDFRFKDYLGQLTF